MSHGNLEEGMRTAGILAWQTKTGGGLVSVGQVTTEKQTFKHMFY
jgi:hypothetical protein